MPNDTPIELWTGFDQRKVTLLNRRTIQLFPSRPATILMRKAVFPLTRLPVLPSLLVLRLAAVTV